MQWFKLALLGIGGGVALMLVALLAIVMIVNRALYDWLGDDR